MNQEMTEEMKARRKNLEDKTQRFKNMSRRWEEADQSLRNKYSTVMKMKSINEEEYQSLQEFRYRMDSLKMKMDICTRDIQDVLIQLNKEAGQTQELSKTAIGEQLEKFCSFEKRIDDTFAENARRVEVLLLEITYHESELSEISQEIFKIPAGNEETPDSESVTEV
ncbi:hypothetical protein NPIL_701621 [Nephila pilipes]|uniref:Uncharacterized protein n=1 Tax=Nephila pilipes TaxID=299642 RepID=A0A8X6TC79_NEPPI|nr:hypothetical protein NPIL_701621 [Nephila pilipes]